MQTNTEIYHGIKTFIQEQIDKSIVSARSSLRSSGGSSISGNYLLKTGDTITGPIAVNAGVTIDGVDISDFYGDTNTALSSLTAPRYLVTALDATLTNERLLAVSGLGLSAADGGAGGNYTITLTSSSNPGAAASVLATDANGATQLNRLGVGVAPTAARPVYIAPASGDVVFGTGTVFSSVRHTFALDPTNTTYHDVGFTMNPVYDTTGTYYNRVFWTTTYPKVTTGVTNSGYAIAGYFEALRRWSGDDGTLALIMGMQFNYGHYQALMSGTTATVYGMLLKPYTDAGDIGTFYDLHIASKSSSVATITNHYSIYQQETTSRNYFAAYATGIGVVPASSGAAKAEIRSTTEQLRVSYSATVYASHTIASTGAYTLTTTHGIPSGAHLYLYPGAGAANVGIGSTSTPSAKVSVTSTAEQLRLLYDTTNRASHTISSAGVYTISTTGTTAANAHIYLNPGGGSAKVGIGNSIPAPTAKLEVNATTEQLRLNYSGSFYASHTVSSTGNYTIAANGSNIYTPNHLLHPSYASQLTAWRISNLGEGDFRYIYVDELHAKAFIADLEQALAGGQIISKSVAKLASNFAAPTAGNTGNLDVEEFAGFAGFHVFADGDLVRLRQFDRSGGGLNISDIWGTVVYSAQVAGSNPPAQRYVFTRHATYPGTGSGTINAGTLVLDYGTSDNGYMEQNAIDGLNGANSPYYQIASWNTHPKSTTAGQGLKLRVRLGQLRGLTGANQWGLYAGTGWTANPNEGNVVQYTVTTPTVNDAHRYILAGDNGVDIYNANLQIYSGTTPVITLDRTGPDLAIGSGSDTMTYTSGAAGFWVGNDSGTYKMRLGSVSGGSLTAGLSWDGSALRVLGSAYIGPQVSYSTTALLYVPFDCTVSGGTVNISGHLGQPATLTGTLATQSGIIAGQAIRIYSGCAVSYAASGNIATSVGSISFWMNPAWDGNDTTNRDILFCGSGYFSANTIRITRAPTSDGGNRIRFLVVDNAAGGRFADYNVPTSGFKTWAYYTFTWKASTGSIKIYRNAVLVASYSGTTWTAGSAGALIEFSKNYPGDQGIQDFAIIGRELTSDEIASIYNSNAPLNVNSSNYSLILADASAAGYVRGHATGLFGYSDQTSSAGTGAFALVTTASTALGAPFGGVTLDAGDMMIGSASTGYSNLYWDQSAGALALRNGTTSRMTLNSSGNLVITNGVGTSMLTLNGSEALARLTGILFVDSNGEVRTGSGTVGGGTFTGIRIMNYGAATVMGGYYNDALQWDIGTAGQLRFGVVAGNPSLTLDSSGIKLTTPTSYAAINALKWEYSGTYTGVVYSLVTTGSLTSTLHLQSQPYSGGSIGAVDVNAFSSSGYSAARFFLVGTPNNATAGPYARIEFRNTSNTLLGGTFSFQSTAATSATMTGAGFVRYRMHYRLVVRASGGNATTLTGDLGVNASTTATVGGTANDFRVGVHTTGYVYWDRVAGTETYDVQFWAICT